MDKPLTSYYLKISGIRGDVVTKPYDGWIEVESFSFGMGQASGSGAGAGAGKDYYNVLNIATPEGNATVPLVQDCASGRHRAEAILVLRRGNAEVMRVIFDDVAITSFQTGGGMHAGPRIDSVQLTSKNNAWKHGSLITVGPTTKPQ